MIQRSAYLTPTKPDLDTMRALTTCNTTKSFSREVIDELPHKNIETSINLFVKKLSKSGFSYMKLRNKLITDESFFDNFEKLFSENKRKYVSVLVRYSDNDSLESKMIIGFDNLETILCDYENCIHGLADYLDTSYEIAAELIEEQSENKEYKKETKYYVLLNDCISNRNLLEYSAAKLQAFEGCVQSFSDKYAMPIEEILEQVKN